MGDSSFRDGGNNSPVFVIRNLRDCDATKSHFVATGTIENFPLSAVFAKRGAAALDALSFRYQRIQHGDFFTEKVTCGGSDGFKFPADVSDFPVDKESVDMVYDCCRKGVEDFCMSVLGKHVPEVMFMDVGNLSALGPSDRDPESTVRDFLDGMRAELPRMEHMKSDFNILMASSVVLHDFTDIEKSYIREFLTEKGGDSKKNILRVIRETLSDGGIKRKREDIGRSM